MSYIHCIVTRFSFRFRKDALINDLLSPERLDTRVKIFKTYCLPSILNQNCKKFYWILIIDPLLPIKYRNQLQELIDAHYDSEQYATKGPRRIWLHTWDWDKHKLERIDWILKYFDQEKLPKFMITTRLDDDDALISNFIQTIQGHLKTKEKGKKIHTFKYISYCVGYHYYVDKNTLRMTQNSMIALGLSLITRVDLYPMCAYLGNHTKIPKYLRKPELHPRMHQLYKRNGDLPVNPKVAMSRLEIIRTAPPVWLRTVHNFNLQSNLKKQMAKRVNQKTVTKIKEILKNKFHIVENQETDDEK